MDKIKLVVLGLGNYGRSWAEVIARSKDGVLVGVADRSEDALNAVTLPVAKYTDINTAIEEQHPDAVVLVVPPHLHIPVSRSIVEKGVTVLCEKPICLDLEEAKAFYEDCLQDNRFCAIGENFRYRPVMREAKRLLTEGTIGKITRVNCFFSHYHPDASAFYHGALKHPLLSDTTIHHLDVARYLMGSEPVNVLCIEHGAPHAWYGERPASAEIISDMNDGSVFCYNGSLAAAISSTDWYGDWELIGDRATMRISGTKITLYTTETESSTWDIPDAGDTREPLLEGFIRGVQENRASESDIRDNYFSFLWMQKAIESSEAGCKVEV